MASLIQAVATYRPRVAKAHTVHLHEMAERLTRGSLVTRSIADMVLADLVDEIRLSLRAGNTVSLELKGVKFQNWGVAMPEDDFVMENLSFKALTISVVDQEAPAGGGDAVAVVPAGFAGTQQA